MVSGDLRAIKAEQFEKGKCYLPDVLWEEMANERVFGIFSYDARSNGGSFKRKVSCHVVLKKLSY